jgi:ABC-type nitrate/sulfonate/bicarbonate transport system ATPase subunit
MKLFRTLLFLGLVWLVVMRNDLARIWQAEKKTILFVRHDIEEASSGSEGW